MSAKAWWTLGILAAPFLYVLTFPPIYHLAELAKDELSSYGSYASSSSPSAEHIIWVEDAMDDVLELYKAPYWTLGSIPPFDMPLLGYYAFWGDRF